ncbi:hypothetical protein JRQ81_004441 [Phrynocephalus forsythii]|uniref:Geranylgeranyl transferase type-2 subunit alpha n=1 Tax=Phrynocephalus forsythii TaxID=171643 RepID=A0A9Q1AV78_9SAUR|nr:hypothetical protein JRQ81_004441 [Phrynocephalus forsythii]
MHGRLKVKTTEEQAEAKRLEREKKLSQYVTATKAIFEKRKTGQLDKEALDLTSQVLGANPDFATLWNFRREIFLHLEKESPEEMQALCKAELSFLESCLRVNPKSYGTWHHRCWVMERIPEPDWARELELCSKFLEVDERNFHCWDYRRFVVQRAQVLPEDELAFSDSLITRNFSNYSSWHYRSCLLPKLYPDPQQQGRINEEILLKELELVQNAFFTDPNDQSAWFYHRWLLGRGDLGLFRTSPAMHAEGGPLFPCFQVAPASHDLIVFGDESPLVVRWRTPDGKNRPGYMWLCDLPPSALNDHWPQHTFRVLWAESEAQKECVLFKGEAIISHPTRCSPRTFLDSQPFGSFSLPCFNPQDTKTAGIRIWSPRSKSSPLTHRPAHPSPPVPLPKAADPMRSAYLDDLRSKYLIENSILKMEYAESRVVDLSQRVRITEATGSKCFICVLEVDDNRIETLEGLPPLPRLEELSLCNNRLRRPSDLRPLASFPRLAHLTLTGNPLCQIQGVQSELTALLPNVATILT